MKPANHSQRNALIELANEIRDHQDWWQFPTEHPIQGFLGTSSIVIVGDQPSTSLWPESHPNRRAFYNTLRKAEASDAHLTDLYKKRGLASELRDGLPRDFANHLSFFRRELEILKPTRVVAVGWLAFDLLFHHVTEIRPILGKMWHFSYVTRSGKLHLYEANMRKAIWRKQAQMKTRLFIKPYCGWCHKAIRWLDDHDIEYQKIDVIADDAAFDEMVRLSGQELAPVIDVNGEILADFGPEELEKFWKTI